MQESLETTTRTEIKNGYLNLDKLEVYLISRKISKIAWEMYNSLDWKYQKLMGDQFLTATDSVGANIAEGYGRFHYLDKIKFYYNSRASLKESRHWFELLAERKLINKEQKLFYLEAYKTLSPKLNGFINASYLKVKQKKN